MQKEVFDRLEHAINELSRNLNFGQYRVTIDTDNNGKFFGSMYFFNISKSNPAYVVSIKIVNDKRETK